MNILTESGENDFVAEAMNRISITKLYAIYFKRMGFGVTLWNIVCYFHRVPFLILRSGYLLLILNVVWTLTYQVINTDSYKYLILYRSEYDK